MQDLKNVNYSPTPEAGQQWDAEDNAALQRALEPGIRECVAIVVMPSFVPRLTLDVQTRWFSLAHPAATERDAGRGEQEEGRQQDQELVGRHSRMPAALAREWWAVLGLNQ